MADWRALPRLAFTLARAFGPSRAGLRWLRPLTTPVWLLTLTAQHAAGSVLTSGRAVLTVEQPRTLRRHLAVAVVFLPTALLVLSALMVPFAAAGAQIGEAAWGTDRGARAGVCVGVSLITALLLWQFGRLIRAGRYSARLRRIMRERRRTGPWLEVGSLASGQHPRSAHALARAVLAWADEQHIGLGAVAVDDRLRRLYIRAGFQPTGLDPLILLRPARTPDTVPGERAG
jgi:hypothetical protein